MGNDPSDAEEGKKFLTRGKRRQIVQKTELHAGAHHQGGETRHQQQQRVQPIALPRRTLLRLRQGVEVLKRRRRNGEAGFRHAISRSAIRSADRLLMLLRAARLMWVRLPSPVPPGKARLWLALKGSF